jgi:5'-deoxy-5'-methylthioadenosine phosphorylase
MILHAVIGGTGVTSLNGLEITHREVVRTPYGEPSGPIVHGRLSGKPIAFLPRHGPGHTIPPHLVNYRANIWALSHVGVRNVIAINAVGAIADGLEPGDIVFPDQIIDYTWGRGHTFFEQGLTRVVHVDFTSPYSARIRRVLCDAARAANVDVRERATYGATQGPRLETAAEIDRMQRDGCDIVGMTGMPEAALARELSLEYAACAVIANRAAGRGGAEITMDEIERNLKLGIARVRKLLEHAIPTL